VAVESLEANDPSLVDIEALSSLVSLQRLAFRFSRVADLSPLGALTSLREISLHQATRVADLSPLASLESLRRYSQMLWNAMV
jgi:Leucine-rich repeat (LRR) protein